MKSLWHTFSPLLDATVDRWAYESKGMDLPPLKKEIKDPVLRQQMLDKALFLAQEQIPKGVTLNEYFTINPTDTLKIEFGPKTEHSGNSEKRYYESIGLKSPTINNKLNKDLSFFLTGKVDGIVTKDGIKMEDAYNFKLSPEEIEKYKKAAKKGDWFAKGRLFVERLVGNQKTPATITTFNEKLPSKGNASLLLNLNKYQDPIK